jgi:hypothetical protein
MFVSFGSDK